MRRSIFVLLTLATFADSALAADTLRDESGVAGLRLGACVSALEDQNGDGAWELLVGAPGYQATGQDAGRVYFWFGGMQLTLNPNATWNGSGGESFGYAVARIGDVNGDGRGDFAVGAPDADDTGSDAGRVYVFYGADPLPTSPALILEGPTASGRFGWAITALGDFDGDGRDDFAVGAPYSNTAGFQAGSVYVYLGRSGGPDTSPDITFQGDRAYGHFGWSLAGAAEFLGGNANCLAVGSPSHDTPTTQIEGKVYVYQGTTTSVPGPDTTVDLVLASSATASADNEFGFSVAAVRSVDGDGDPDLAVGLPFYAGGGLERGRAEIFFGGLDADAVSDRAIDGPGSNSNFGWSVAGVGDVEGSILPDVVIGAPYDDQVASNAGRAFIWTGGSGNVGDADSLPQVDRGGASAGTEAGDLFGTWCAWAGDLDGDSLDDYAVSAPSGNVDNNTVAGWVRFQDSSGEAVPVQFGGWTCAWNADGGAAGSIGLTLGTYRIRNIVFVRNEAGRRTVLHDGPPAPDSAAWADGDRLHLVDADLAYQYRSDPVYDLDIELVDGAHLVQTQLDGPAGATPATPMQLQPAYPNPFNPRTTVSFRASFGESISLRVLDLRGRLVCTLYAGPASGSWQQATWGGRDDRGAPEAAGVYLVQLRAGEAVSSRRVVLVK